MQRPLMRIPILVFVVMLAAGKVWAQDPVKVAPKNFKVVLENDHVPAGVADGGKDDNIIYDFTNGVSASGFGHPECSAAATAIGEALPQTHPIGH